MSQAIGSTINPAGNDSASALAECRVVVVAPAALVAMFLERTLKRAPVATVTVVRSLTDGISEIRRAGADVVVVSTTTNIERALVGIREIKAEWSHICVVLFAGRVTEDESNLLQAAGVAGVIMKPCSGDAFVTELRRIHAACPRPA